MLLYIIRHAWAYEQDSDRWPDDGERPLTKEGIARFRKVARALVERGCLPDLIATSPLVRCVQTAEILLDALGTQIPLVRVPALSPGSDLEELLAWSAEQEAESLAWVGHAPDVGELLAALIGSGDASIRFAKGSAAAIRFDEVPAAGEGELQWLVTAKLLGE